ncbi:IS200/IS605 family transposase [Desulfococcaceae bacterium HSG8]|nr:IS200/IS605 family transposase [Desulfococcaceae bacterium HSG8]
MGTYANLIFHIVFGTKNRVPMITPKLETELYPYIGGITREEDGIMLSINGTEDHVHIVAKLKPRHSIPEILKRIKGNSSKWINDNKKIGGRFSWQIGYGIFSVSESQLPSVLGYVANQKKHHQKKTFEEEFIQLLEKHGIEYDPKYLWE